MGVILPKHPKGEHVPCLGCVYVARAPAAMTDSQPPKLPHVHTHKQAKGLPQVRQFISYFSILQPLLPRPVRPRYNRDFYHQALPLFEGMDTPLFAFVASDYLGVHINDAHLFREVRCLGLGW